MNKKIIYSAIAFSMVIFFGCNNSKKDEPAMAVVADTASVTPPPYTIQLQEFVNPKLPDLQMTTLDFSTNNKNAASGILSIPFIDANIETTSLDAIFWIETIKGSSKLQLQYTQTINLVFPPGGSALPFVWPHITINTLTKV